MTTAKRPAPICDYPITPGKCGRPAVARIDYGGSSGHVCDAHRDVLPWWRPR